MKQLTFDIYEKLCLSGPVITDEREIKKYLKHLTPINSINTINNDFSIFKHTLYTANFYSFYNSSYDKSSFNVPDFPKSHYMVLSTFMPVCKLILHHLLSSGFLKITPYSYSVYVPDDYTSAYAYSKTSFFWNIPKNFMPVFSSIVYATIQCIVKTKSESYSINNFLEAFMQISISKDLSTIFSNNFSVKNFINLKSSRIVINTSQEDFHNILNKWSEIYLAIPFFQNMDYYLFTYSLNSEKYENLLYESIRGLVATLTAPTAFPAIYPFLTQLLKIHINKFPNADDPDGKKVLFSHEVCHKVLKEEWINIEIYVNLTKEWICDILSDVWELILLLKNAELDSNHKLSQLNLFYERYKNRIKSIPQLVEKRLDSYFDTVSSSACIDHYTRDEHIQLLRNTLGSCTKIISERLDSIFTKLQSSLSNDMISLEQEFSSFETSMFLQYVNLNKTHSKLKSKLNQTDLPILLKETVTGTLFEAPLNHYSNLYFNTADLYRICSSLHLDTAIFAHYINLACSVTASTLFPAYLPAQLAFALSCYACWHSDLP